MQLSPRHENHLVTRSRDKCGLVQFPEMGELKKTCNKIGTGSIHGTWIKDRKNRQAAWQSSGEKNSKMSINSLWDGRWTAHFKLEWNWPKKGCIIWLQTMSTAPASLFFRNQSSPLGRAMYSMAIWWMDINQCGLNLLMVLLFRLFLLCEGVISTMTVTVRFTRTWFTTCEIRLLQYSGMDYHGPSERSADLMIFSDTN